MFNTFKIMFPVYKVFLASIFVPFFFFGDAPPSAEDGPEEDMPEDIEPG
jgi:hypothetical protein